MARRRFRPTTEQFDERLIVRKQETFNGGTVSDVEAVDIPSNAVARLVNARGHKNAIRGRTGAQEWTSLKIPPLKSFGAVYAGDTLTGTWTPEDVGSTYYADTGDILFLVEYIDENSIKVEASSELVEQTFTSGDVVPRINAQMFDALNGIRYFLIGTKVYARIGKELEWIEYFILGDQPTNTTSQMFKFKDKILLTNSNGVYMLNSVYDGKYGWKTNDFLPEYKLDLPSPEINATRPSAYNYVYTYARLNGNYTEDRNSVATYTELETPPVRVDDDIVPTGNYSPEVLNTDFATMYVNDPIYDVYKQEFSVYTDGIWGNTYNSHTTWVDLSEDNKNPTLTISLNGEDNQVFFDFSIVESMDDVTEALQRGFKDCSAGFWILRKMVDDSNTFAIYHTDQKVEWGLVDTGSISGATDLIYENIIRASSDYEDTMGLTVGKFRYPENRKDITHYPLYRSKDIYPQTQDVLDLTDPRIGNSSNILSWVADIPAVETIAANVIQNGGEWYIYMDDPEKSIIGSTYQIDEVTPTAKVKVESQLLGNPNVFKVSWVQGVQAAYDSVSLFTGTDTVFTAEKSDNNIAISGYTVTDEDIGKPIFWSDGTISYLTSTTTTLDSDIKVSQRAYISPTERSYYDTMSDNIRDGYAYYHTLKTRFYDKLPQSNLASYNKGLLVLALRDYNKLYYSDTSDLPSIGYNHPNQVNDSIEKGIRCLLTVKDVFAIFTTTTTHTINPKQSTVLETDFGEFYTAMPDAFLVNGSIGASGQFRWALGEKGDVMIITNEPAVRFFDGTTFTANLADGRIQNTELKLLNDDMLTSYSSIGGIHIWGFRSGLWE